MELLRAIGYYRLSAYVYPFRAMLPEEERCIDSPVHYRSDSIQPGTTFEQVTALWQFDRLLRARILDGLEVVEVGLRTQIAYVLGARDRFGHVNRESLDEQACAWTRDGSGDTDAFGLWLERYTALQNAARNEDFVVHHREKYGEPLPVWVALEFLDFGALSRLYGLLDRRDQNRIASELGVKGGRLLAKWLKCLNYVRNTAAHHSRLWNRALTLKIGEFHPDQVGGPLRHAAALPSREKIYVPLAVTAYLAKGVYPSTRWPVNMRDVLRKFPDLQGLSPEQDMGFPEGWETLELWKP
jgi:abortive infection bacteriophage resistance protein